MIQGLGQIVSAISREMALRMLDERFIETQQEFELASEQLARLVATRIAGNTEGPSYQRVTETRAHERVARAIEARDAVAYAILTCVCPRINPRAVEVKRLKHQLRDELARLSQASGDFYRAHVTVRELEHATAIGEPKDAMHTASPTQDTPTDILEKQRAVRDAAGTIVESATASIFMLFDRAVHVGATLH